MKKIIVGSILVLLLAGCLTYSTSLNQSKPNISSKKDISQVVINGQAVKVEVAVSREERYRGLSNRKSLPQDQGMLFIFSDYAVRSFWMNEMLIPLDIIWIKDSTIVGLEYSVDTPPPLVSYHSPEPVNYVLEVNAGWAKSYSITTGDTVKYIR
ncbi:MAG: DUF192 domain-containing protein [bacterium]